MVRDHKLKISGNQTKAKIVHHLGAEKKQHTHIAPGTKKQPNPKKATKTPQHKTQEHIPMVARKILSYNAINRSNLAVQTKEKP